MNIQSTDQIARALIHEMDMTFQRVYHQSLDEVLGDLSLHYLLRETHLSPDRVIDAVRHSGILDMSNADAVASLRMAVDRYSSGTLTTCIRCGITMNPGDVEQHPTIFLCDRCRT